MIFTLSPGPYISIKSPSLHNILCSYKTAITIPPATAPNPAIHTPVGAAPPVLELELELLEPVVLAPVTLPVVDFPVELPPAELPSVELVLGVFVASVALPVIAPGP